MQTRDDASYYAFTTTDVSLINGMSYFKDTAVFRRVIESLLSLNEDSVFIDFVQPVPDNGPYTVSLTVDI